MYYKIISIENLKVQHYKSNEIEQLQLLARKNTVKHKSIIEDEHNDLKQIYKASYSNILNL